MASHCASAPMQQPVCTCPQHPLAPATPTPQATTASTTTAAAAAAPAGPVYHPRTSLPTTMPLIMDPSHFGSEAAFFHHQQQQLALYGAQMMALAQQQQQQQAQQSGATATGAVTPSSSLTRNTTTAQQPFGFSATTTMPVATAGMGVGVSRQLSSTRSSVSAPRADNTTAANNMMMPMTMPIHMPHQQYYHNQQHQLQHLQHQQQQQQQRQKSSSSPRHHNNAAAFIPPPLPLEEMIAIYEAHRTDLTVFATTTEGKMVLQGLLMLNHNSNNNNYGGETAEQQQQQQQIQQDVCTELMAVLLPVLDDIALDDNGCHVVRCLVEKLTDYDALKTFIEAMNETLYLNLCTLSQDTRRIPQALFEAHNRSHSDLLEPVIAIMAGNIHYLAATQQGCIALMRVFEACFPDQKYRMMSPLVPTFAELACDGFGNYVVQCAIEHSEPHVAAQYVTAAFTGKCMRLATNKFASNVLEKMVRKLSHLPSVRRLVMEEIMFEPSALQTAVEDCFANFVVQSIIETAINVAELRKMMERLKPALPSSLYATKIESKLRQKNYAMNNTGMEMNNNNNNNMGNNNMMNNNMGMRQQQQNGMLMMTNSGMNNNNNRLRNNTMNNNNIAGPVYAPNTMYAMQQFAMAQPHEMMTTATSTETENIIMNNNNHHHATTATAHTVVSTATNTEDIINESSTTEANNNNNNNKENNNNKSVNNNKASTSNNKENATMPSDSAILSIKKNTDNNNNNNNNKSNTANTKSTDKSSSNNNNNKADDTPMTFTPYNPSPFYGRNNNNSNNNNSNNASSAGNGNSSSNNNNNGKNYNNNNNNNNRNSRHHGRKVGGHHHNRRPLSEVH